MIVTDANVLAPALFDDGPDGSRLRRRLRGEDLTAPELVDLEVLSALRGLVRAGLVSVDRARAAVADLGSLPVRRVPHRPLLERCFALRDNLTAYDAAYVALAEVLGVTLVTADARLAAAPGLRCHVEVVGLPR